jgi:hypothetical protein
MIRRSIVVELTSIHSPNSLGLDLKVDLAIHSSTPIGSRTAFTLYEATRIHIL